MAISRQRKEEIVAQARKLLESSKLTVLVYYEGLSVAQFQQLRVAARQSQTTVRVIKNRLVRQALQELKILNDDVANQLKGALVYVFSEVDEVAGAQLIKSFVKASQTDLKFAGAITESGSLMSVAEVTQIANLAPKPQLLGQLSQRLCQPIHQLQHNLGNNLPQLIANLKAHKI